MTEPQAIVPEPQAPAPARKLRLRRLLLYGALSLLAVLLLAAALVAALPALISTPSAQNLVRQSLSQSLKREVAWTALGMSWSDGLTLRGFRLGAGAAPLLQATLGDLLVQPRVTYRDGRARLDLVLRVSSLAVQLAPGPPKPPKPYQEPLTALAKGLQQFEALDWYLPVDLGLSLSLAPVQIGYHDPKSGRQLALKNASLRCEVPSLADRPVALELHGDLEWAGKPLQPLSFKGELKQLVVDRHLRPAAALVNLNASLPGSSLELQGGLRQPEGFLARARVDLPKVMPLAGAFAPAPLPNLYGTLTLDLKAKSDAAHNLQAALELNGSRLALEGGALKRRRVGPLEIRARQKVLSDHQRQQVRFAEGEASIGNWLKAQWEASVERPAERDRDLAARLGPVQVDLRQALAAAAPFLPPRFPLRAVQGEFSLRQLELALQGRKNRGELKLDRLGLRLPTLRLALSQGMLSADRVELALNQATIPLTELKPVKVDALMSAAAERLSLSGAKPLAAEGVRGELRLSLSELKAGGTAVRKVAAGGAKPSGAPFFPGKVDASLSYDARRLSLAGPQTVSVAGARGGMELALADLALSSSSPRKVVATGELKQSLELSRVDLERKLALDNLHQELQAGFRAREDGTIEVSLPRFKFSSASLKARAAGKELQPAALAAQLSASGIRLPAAGGAAPSLERFDLTLTAGDFLSLAASGALPAATPGQGASDGTLRVDLGRALPFAAPFLPKGTGAAGEANLAWRLALPTAPKKAPPGQAPLAAAKAALEQVERGDIALTLATRDLVYPLPGGKVQLAELRSTQPVRLLLPGKGGNITLKGALDFSGLKGLPGKGATLPAQEGSLTLDGELAQWQSLKLHQELKLKQFAVLQRADLSIGRLGALLERKEPLGPALLLQRLDAVLNADLAARFPATPTPVPGGAKLSGELSAALRLNLVAGRDLRVSAGALTRDFGAQLPDGTTLEGMNADLLLERNYALAQGEPSGWTPLSTSLVRPAPDPFASQGAAELAGRVREDLRGEVRGSRRFTIRRLATGAGNGKEPIVLTALEGDLLCSNEQAGLSFLQTELLGGTLRLRGLVDLKPEVPAVSAACSFSNLETYLLLPVEQRELSRRERRDTAVTGEVSFDAPLVTGQRELLEGIRAQLSLRRIGADTLERALFGLDPYERNEQIVAQRKLLRQGSLKRLRAGTLDGSLSFDGDVLVRGVQVALPRAERIRLAELPIQKELARGMAGVATARKMLDLLRADTLTIGPKGEFTLGRRGHE